MKKPFYFLLLLSVILELGCENKPTNPQESAQSNWEIGPFIKQDAENPILIPNPELVFLGRKQPLKQEMCSTHLQL